MSPAGEAVPSSAAHARVAALGLPLTPLPLQWLTRIKWQPETNHELRCSSDSGELC